MFTELFKPILTRIHPCTIEEVRHNIQKEKRIIDTLEPVMNQHKLVIDPKVLREDFKSAQTYTPETSLKYQLVYQLSRITKDRGAITQDDRLDALAIAVAYWVEQMAQDADQQIKTRHSENARKELENFMESFHKRKGTDNALKWL